LLNRYWKASQKKFILNEIAITIMGNYTIKKETIEKYHQNHQFGILDDVGDRIHQFLLPQGKTIDEVLKKLYEIEEEMEESVGGIMRILKFQRQNAKLTEEQELLLMKSRNLSILIHDVEELKKWAQEC
jgi:hypothetical protein